ncbi:MAG TPA: MmcQ/YjbR family DNA-binding protein [Longimicrobium sp.]|nr:MmcQ/YjbR family DNA-binding protein [Longimicrobium sp.]
MRKIALSLPEAEEKETWGEATFRVRDKIFTVLGETGKSAGVKASKEDQALLIASDPETFSVSEYVGRFGWVTVQLARVDAKTMEALIIDAWRRTAPKRTVKEYDAGQGTTSGAAAGAPAAKSAAKSGASKQKAAAPKAEKTSPAAAKASKTAKDSKTGKDSKTAKDSKAKKPKGS